MATSNTTCSNGLVGLENNSSTVCCDAGCDQCGGVGCGITTITGLTGDDCCSSTIETNGQLCSVTDSAPCVLDAPEATSNSTCSNGLVGIENSDGTVCCDSRCGQCGGSGCGDMTGLSGDDCCTSEITLNGELCSVTEAAPCVLDTVEVVSSNCTNGLAGVESSDGTVCCAEACNGQCGGVGCGSIDGTNGATDCCSVTILASGVSCDDSAEAPCIIVNGTTDAPTASPTGIFTFEPTNAVRGGDFSMSPTAAPSAFDPTTTSPMVGDSSAMEPTLFPGLTMPPTSDASAASAGVVLTLAAMAGGIFAVFAAARK